MALDYQQTKTTLQGKQPGSKKPGRLRQAELNYEAAYDVEYPAFPGLPELDPYTGKTSIPIPLNYFRANKLAGDLLSGKTGVYRTLLEGDPNWELFNRAVVVPGQQELTSQVLPQIASIYGATPYGPSYFSGAREEAQGRAVQENANKLAELRLAYDSEAKNRSLSAVGALPSLLSPAGNISTIRNANLDRAIQVHYQNEGLEQQEFQNAVAETQYAFDVANAEKGDDVAVASYYLNKEIERKAKKDAKKAGLSGLTGTLLGAGIGAATGGFGLGLGALAGGALGSSLGGAVGSYVGGVPVDAGGLVTTGLSTMANYQMKQNYLNNLNAARFGYTPASQLGQSTINAPALSLQEFSPTEFAGLSSPSMTSNYGSRGPSLATYL